VRVLIPDEPGQLGRLFADIGEIGANVEEFHLDHGLGQPFGVAEIDVVPAAVRPLEDSARGWPSGAGGCTAEPPVGFRLMTAPLTIAIDGPSGSGKSSVSRAVARHLGVGFLDTGAMYRALTWWCLERGVDLTDADAVAAPRATSRSRSVPTPTPHRVRRRDRRLRRHSHDEGQHLGVGRSPPTSRCGPSCSSASVTSWHRIAQETGGVVAEGRDITTVVAPDASVRVLLTASEEARLRRRSAELHGATDAAAVEAHP
jgi:cytidylate kinase